MGVFSGKLSLSSRGRTDIIDVTGRLAELVAESGQDTGLACLFVPGSTGGLTTIEYEDGAVADLAAALERMAPEGMHYQHDARWGDGNGFSHVRAALLGPSLTVPFQHGSLELGTWQQVVFIDFDNRSRKRELIVRVVGE